jgi:hypothetical protein
VDHSQDATPNSVESPGAARYASERNPSRGALSAAGYLCVVGWGREAGKEIRRPLSRAHGEWRACVRRKLERGFSEQDKRNIVKRLTPLRMRKQVVIAARKSFPKARWVNPWCSWVRSFGEKPARASRGILHSRASVRTWRGKFDHLGARSDLETQTHCQYSLTISELHHSFALFLFSFSGPMTQNGRGATKWGKAKNDTASNRDKLRKTLCRI